MQSHPRSALTVALVGYLCLIFALTHVPIRSDPLPGHSDKLIHLLMYAGLSFLLAWRLRAAGMGGARLVAVVLAIVAVYGALDELLQIPVGRHADFYDWLADCAGGVLGIASFAVARGLWQRLGSKRRN